MSYRDEVLADSPVGYWRLGESSGTTAADETANNNDGTYTGSPTLGVTGPGQLTDTGITLDGSSQYVDLGSPAALNTSLDSNGTITLEAWIKPHDTADGQIVACSSGGGLGWRLTYRYSSTGPSNPNGISVLVQVDGSSWEVKHLGANTITVNTWNHVAATVDSSNFKLYVNGTLEETAARSNSTLQFDDLGVSIGRLGSFGSELFDGSVDEVAIYDSALSSTRVQAHYKAATAVDHTEDVTNTPDVGTTTYDALIDVPIDHTEDVTNTAAITTTTYDAWAGETEDHTASVTNTPDVSLQVYEATAFITVYDQTLRPTATISEEHWGASGYPTIHEALYQDDGTVNSNDFGVTGPTHFEVLLETAQTMTESGDGTFSWRVRNPHESVTLSVLSGSTTLKSETYLNEHTGTWRWLQVVIPAAELNSHDLSDLRFRVDADVSSANDNINSTEMVATLPGYTIPQDHQAEPDSASVTLVAHDPEVFSDRDELLDVDTAAITTTTYDVEDPGHLVKPPQVAIPISQHYGGDYEDQEGTFRSLYPFNSAGSRDDGYLSIDGWDRSDGYLYVYYNTENTTDKKPDVWAAAYKLTDLDNPWQPEKPHTLYWRANRPESYWSGIMYLAQGYDVEAELWDKLIRTQGWSTSETVRDYTINLNQEEIESITDWSDLWIILEMRYGAIKLSGGVPPRMEFYGVEWVTPSAVGVAGVQVDNTPNISIFTWDVEITATSTVPNTENMAFNTHPASITPELALSNQMLIGSTTSPYFRVMNSSTGEMDEGWPSPPSAVTVVNGNPERIVVGHSTGLQVYDSTTKEALTGYPTSLSREPSAIAISPDGSQAAVGTVSSTLSNWGSGTTAHALRVFDLQSKQEVPYPDTRRKVTALAYNSAGTRLAMGYADAPYLQVYDTSTQQVVSGYPSVPNHVVALRYVNNRLFVLHRAGNRLTVINADQTVDSGWPQIPGIPNAFDFDVSTGRFVVAWDDHKLSILNTQTKSMDSNYPSLAGRGHHINTVQWVGSNIVAAGQDRLTSDTSDEITFMRVDTHNFDTGWPLIAGDIRSIRAGGSIAPVQEDTTQEVDNTADAALATYDAVVDVLQEVQVPTAELVVTTFDAEVSSPDITITPSPATMGLATYNPVIYPVNQELEVDNTPLVELAAHAPTVSATAPLYRLIPVDSTTTTARDATEVTKLDLGTVMHGKAKTVSFRVGNTDTATINFRIRARSQNSRLLKGVRFSQDGQEWSESLTIHVKGNAVSDAIHMRVEPPDNALTGDCSVLLDITQAAGVGVL